MAAATQYSSYSWDTYKVRLAALARLQGVRESTIQSYVPGLDMNSRAIDLERTEPVARTSGGIVGALAPYLRTHVTRSLPVCMGVHAAWNFAQGTIYGIPVSGSPAEGWLVSSRSGPDWLSGGVFGAEASVVALTLCTLCSLGLLLFALRRGSIVLPCWQRRNP